jgi:predicted nucleic acid-binding protein
MALSGRVYLDANAFIFYGEQHPAYAKRIQNVFKAAEAGHLTIVTSQFTLMEVLVRPYQLADQPLILDYERLLTPRAELETCAIDWVVLKRAAELRATLKIKTPDAIHVAAAEITNCATVLSEDHGLRVSSSLALARISALPP